MEGDRTIGPGAKRQEQGPVDGPAEYAGEREWRGLYDRQRQEQKAETKSASTLRGRFQRWREKGSHLGQLRTTLTRNSERWRRWRSELETRHQRERVELGKKHTAVAQDIKVRADQYYNYQVAHGVIGVEVSSQVRREREQHGLQPQRAPERQPERQQRGPERERDYEPSR